MSGSGTSDTALARLQALARRLRLPTFVKTLTPTMAALALQLAAFVITARGLGASAFGIYTSILAVSLIANELIGLGANDVMMRATARDHAAFPKYFGHMLSMTALTFVPAVLICAAIITGPLRVDLAFGWVALALTAEMIAARVVNTLDAIMVAHGDTVRSGLLRLQGALVRVVAAVTYFGILGQESIAGWISTVTVIAAVLTLYTWHVCVRQYGRPQRWFAHAEIVDGMLLGLPQLAFMLLCNVDRVALARFVPYAEVGAYGAASRAMQIGLFPLQVGTRITYPQFFAPENSGARRGLRFALKVSGPMLALGLLSQALVVGVSYTIPFIFGQGFASAQPILVVLAISLPLTGLVTPAADVLTALNRQGLRAACYLVVAVLFVGAALQAAQWQGALGVAWAYVGALALLAVAVWACVLVLARREARS